MKRLLSLFAIPVLAAFLFNACSQGSATSTGTSSSPAVKVGSGKVSINGTTVVPDWSLTGFKKVLGEADRPREGYNKTHTYDTKGIVLFEPYVDKVLTGRVSEVQYYFGVPEPNNVTPKGTFSGTIMVDKLKVSSTLTPSVMRSKLKGWTESDSYMDHNFRMANSGLYIYFQFSDDEKSLLKISIGPDKAKS